jgi:glutathione S-transferase
MLKLHGFAVSNYFNMVKHTLLYKQLAFDEITVYPPGDAAYREKSPLGKVPCLETEHGTLVETSVILEYLEAAYPEKPLMPADVWGQAKVRELMKISELYIELQGRRLMPGLFQGKPLDEALLNDVRVVMKKGASAVQQLASFSPWLLGERKTLADIVLLYSLGMAEAARQALGFGISERVPALPAWQERMMDSEIARNIHAEFAEQLPAFIEQMQRSAAAQD